MHAVEAHVPLQFLMLQGLGNFSKDFVERLHQFGIKENHKAMRAKDRAEKFFLFTEWEQLRKNKAVIDKKKELSVRRQKLKKEPKGDKTLQERNESKKE